VELQNHYICTMITFPLFISGAEIFFIVFIVVMVFGADKVPEIARGLGKGMRQIKDATNDIKSEINKSAKKEGIDLESPEKLTDDFKHNFTKDISSEIKNVKDTVDDITGPIKRKF
jgi:sec-independent protein translocase protein TatA